MFKARKYKILEKRLGYRFKNEALLARALTHASLRGAKKVREDNERLEFVGLLLLVGLISTEKCFEHEGPP